MSGQVPSSRRSTTTRHEKLELTDKQEFSLTRLLAQHIGPLAHTIVAREAARTQKLDDLLNTLAAEIDDEPGRKQFLQKAKKLVFS